MRPTLMGERKVSQDMNPIFLDKDLYDRINEELKDMDDQEMAQKQQPILNQGTIGITTEKRYEDDPDTERGLKDPGNITGDKPIMVRRTSSVNKKRG